MPDNLTRSQHTITGNYRARYFSEISDPLTNDWRVEFIDSDTSTTAKNQFGQPVDTIPHEIKTTGDGFVIDYDGDTDHLTDGIIPSTVTVTYVIENNTHEKIIDALKTAKDGRFGLAIYRSNGSSWVPWWVGVLNYESVEYELQDLPFMISLTASCGLNRLRDIPFSGSDGSSYQGKKTLASIISICLNKIPTRDFWLSDDLKLSEVVDIYNEDHVGTWSPTAEGDLFPHSMIEKTMTRSEIFYQQEDVKEDEFGRRIHYPPNFNSCFDVLESITTTFGFRVFQSEFQFWFFPSNAYNWNRQLNVHSWTMSQVLSEDIDLEQNGGTNVFEETSQLNARDFTVNIDEQHSLREGWVNSFLLPVKKTTVTHKNAGQQSVFGSPASGYIDYPNAQRTFSNPTFTVNSGQTLNLRGQYDAVSLVNEFGIGSGAFDIHGVDRVGARIILRLKIKVGDYYYKSGFTVENETTNIDMPTGQGDLNFKRLIFETPTWTLTESTYDIIIPWWNSSPEPSVEISQGWTRVGGLHIQATGQAEFEYQINGTQWENVLMPFNLMTAPLPDDFNQYTGVSVDIDRVVVTATGDTLTTFADIVDVVTAGFVQPYDEDGNTIGTAQNIPGDRLNNFFVGIGENDSDGDVIYTAFGEDHVENLDLGETLLGDSNLDGEPQTNGALWVLETGSTIFTDFNLSSFNWKSLVDSFADNDGFSGVLEVLVREQLFNRSEPRPIQRGVVQQEWRPAVGPQTLHMTDVWSHNCSTVGDEIDYLVPFRFSFTAGTGEYDADLFLLKRVRISFEEATDKVDRLDGTNGGPGPGVGTPSSGVPNAFDFGENLGDIVDEVIPDDVNSNPLVKIPSLDVASGQTKGKSVNLKASDNMVSSYDMRFPGSLPLSKKVIHIDETGVVTYEDASGGGGGGGGSVLANGNANISNTGQNRFIPLGNHYVDTSSRQIYSPVTAPFDGDFGVVTIQFELASGSTIVRIWNGTTELDSETIVVSAGDVWSLDFSGNTFSQGDLLYLSVHLSATAGNVYSSVLLNPS